MLHLTRRIAIAGLILLTAAPALAAPAPTPPLSPEDQALVAKAAAYLQDLPTVKGRFEQTDARGHVSGGELYLSRPGKARFAYDPPSSKLVISDGHWVGISDPRLKTFDRYPLGATPLALFLAKQVRLDKGVVVDRVERTGDGFLLSAVDGHHRRQGRITLVFGDNPMALKEWSLTDAQGQVTRVKIVSLEPAGAVDSAMFTLHGPQPPVPRGEN
jgi:outer membrane lipoprotein-sorting protein